MSHDFVTALQLQLREAALREERRSPLRRALARPPGGALAAAVAIAFLLALIVAVGGLDWGDRAERQAAPRVVANFQLAPTLGPIDAGFGSMWVADDTNGRLLRVDPRSRRVQRTVPIGDAFTLAAGAGAVWTLDAPGRLARIDPRTNRITSRRQLRPELRRHGVTIAQSFGVSIARGVPWVLTSKGALRIDPATGEAAGFIRVPGGDPRFVTLADDGLWVLTRDARVLSVDLDSGRQTASLPVRLQDALALAPTPAGPILFTADGRIARAALSDGRLAWSRQVSAGFTAPPVQIGGALWIHAVGDATPDRLIAFDVATGATRSETRLPEFGATGAARVGGDLWITTPTGKVMVIRR